ncbi:MAG: hypothetical protein RH949_21260 [Coleofasciculus sp. A1-SPW-01]|uniref:hypothetical protein n=1 Tax=Coleofasciculus sp. A1-SPW-01 TaxID=3070819 RepID=UPI003300B3CC
MGKIFLDRYSHKGLRKYLTTVARNNSYVTYDANLIIAAQAVVIKSIGIDVIIATTDTENFNRLIKQHRI